MKNWNYSRGHAPHFQAQVYNEKGETIAATYNDENAENAKLIAYAPELLQALEVMIDRAEREKWHLGNDTILKEAYRGALNIVNEIKID